MSQTGTSGLVASLRDDEVTRALKSLGQYRPPPTPSNPHNEPPLDPAIKRRFEVDIAYRINRPLRMYWSPLERVFMVQEKIRDEWRTRFAIYDGEAARTVDGHLPFVMPDERHVKEFCESNLEIMYNTGDVDKDMMLGEAANKARADIDTAYEKACKAALADEVISGGDPVRLAKAQQHTDYHGANAGFRGNWSVGIELAKK